MAGSSWGKDGSLKAQRLDRSQVGGARGRIGAEEQARGQCCAEGQKDRVGGDLRVYARDLELAADHANRDAGDTAEQRYEHRLRQELGEDVRTPGADSLADADPTRALGEAHANDVD